MAREITVTCDFCGKKIDKPVAKLYLAPILPGKTLKSFQAQYTHYGDLCDTCAPKVMVKLKRRQPRSQNGKVKTATARKRAPAKK